MATEKQVIESTSYAPGFTKEWSDSLKEGPRTVKVVIEYLSEEDRRIVIPVLDKEGRIVKPIATASECKRLSEEDRRITVPVVVEYLSEEDRRITVPVVTIEK